MKVLIVDDAKIMRSIVKRTLRKAGFSGLDVIEAENGQDALDKLRASSFDLVLSDWNMPTMDGYQLLQEVKKNDIKVKFGFVTSEGTADMRKKAKEAGAFCLITKPFTAETFQETLGPVI